MGGFPGFNPYEQDERGGDILAQTAEQIRKRQEEERKRMEAAVQAQAPAMTTQMNAQPPNRYEKDADEFFNADTQAIRQPTPQIQMPGQSSYGQALAGGPFSPEALARAASGMADDSTKDPNNLLDNIMLGAFTSARQQGQVPAGTPRLSTLQDSYNSSLSRYMTGDPNKLIGPDGQLNLNKKQKASLILQEMFRGIAQGPKYKGLHERLQEEAQKEFQSKVQAAQVMNTMRKNQELERAHMANEQLGGLRAKIMAENNIARQDAAIQRMNIDVQSKNAVQNTMNKRLLLGLQNLDQKGDMAEKSQALKEQMTQANIEHLNRTGGDWKREAELFALATYRTQHPELDNAPDEMIKRDPAYFKVYEKELGDFAEAASKRDPSSSIISSIITKTDQFGRQFDTLVRRDRAGNVTQTPFNLEPGPIGNGIPAQPPRLSDQARKEADALRVSADAAGRAMSALSQIIADGSADDIVGPVSGNTFMRRYRGMLGQKGLNESFYSSTTLKQALADVKQNNGANSSDREYNRLAQIFAQPMDDWRSQANAVAALQSYAALSAERKMFSLDTTTNPDGVHRVVTAAAAKYMRDLQKRHDENQQLKAARKPLLPAPTMPSGEQMLRLLDKWYGFENGRLRARPKTQDDDAGAND